MFLFSSTLPKLTRLPRATNYSLDQSERNRNKAYYPSVVLIGKPPLTQPMRLMTTYTLLMWHKLCLVLCFSLYWHPPHTYSQPTCLTLHLKNLHIGEMLVVKNTCYPGSGPSTHLMSHNYFVLGKRLSAFFWVQWAAGTDVVQIYTYRKTCIHINFS